MNVGITGQSGFVGTHLFNTLGLYVDKFTRIPFEDEFFQDTLLLERFVSQCDVIGLNVRFNSYGHMDVCFTGYKRYRHYGQRSAA